jgi:hypothetical protein
MTSEPRLYILCLTDSNSLKQGKVDPLRKSLHDQLIMLDMYDPALKNHSKLFSILTYLISNASQHIQDHDILVIVDAFDVLCQKPNQLEQMKEEFLCSSKKIIYSAEQHYSHHDIQYKPFWNTLNPTRHRKYLNSGGIITYKGYYVRLLQHITSNFSKYIKIGSYSDQRIHGVHWAAIAGPNEIREMGLDTDSHFFYNYSVQEPAIKPGQIQSYFIHFPFLPHKVQTQRFKEYYDYLCPLNAKDKS